MVNLWQFDTSLATPTRNILCKFLQTLNHPFTKQDLYNLMKKIKRDTLKGHNSTEALKRHLVSSQTPHHELLDSNTRSLRQLTIIPNLEYSLVNQDVLVIDDTFNANCFGLYLKSTLR